MAETTLKQIAERAGVSIRTVNRVLKNQGSVVPDKRELILKLAGEMRYSPNMAARNLRLQRKSCVGILSRMNGAPVYAKKLHDLENRLEKLNFYPLLGNFSNVEQFEVLASDWAGMVKYLVVMTSISDLSRFKEICTRHALVPVFFDSDGGENTHSLLIDRTGGICDAVTHLIRSGRRKILWCGSLESRRKGFLRAFENLKDEALPPYEFLSSAGEFPDGFRLGAEIVRSGADAVFFDTDRMAMGFLNYALEQNIRVPERVAAIGFDDDPAGLMVYPALSTVAHPVEELNSCIAEIVSGKTGSGWIRRIFSTRFLLRASAR